MPWDSCSVVDRHADLAQERGVWRESGHEVDATGLEPLHALVRMDADRVRIDARDTRAPTHRDAPLLHAILEVREHPGFDALVERRPEMHQGDPGSRPPEIERGFSRRVTATDHDNLLEEGLVSLAIDVRDVRQLLSRDVDPVRGAEIARRDDDCPRARLTCLSGPLRMHDEPVPCVLDLRDALVLSHRDLEMLHHRSVVRERVTARRLLGGNDERDVTERQLFRGGEKPNVGRVIGDGAADDRCLEHDRFQALALRTDGRSEATGTSTDYDEIT